LHQRNDHRHSTGCQARPGVMGTREVPDHEYPLPGPVLQSDSERADHEGVVDVARDHERSTLRNVPEDLRPSKVQHVADPRLRAGIHEPRSELLYEVAGGASQEPRFGPEEPRQAARRPGGSGWRWWGRRSVRLAPASEAGA